MAKKPGKYDHLLPNLPKTHGTEAKYQDRVEAQKKELRKCQTCKDLSAELQASCIACNGNGRRKLTPELMGVLFAQQRARKELVELTLSAVNCELEALTQMLIASQEQNESGWGAYGAADNALRLTSGDGLRTQPEIYPVVFDKNAFRDWLVGLTVFENETDEYRAARLASFAANPLTSKLTLPIKELNDMVKDRLLRGQPEPPGVKVYVRTKIVFSEMQTETVAETTDVF